MNEAVKNPINPIIIENENAPCQEVVHYATDEEFDIRKILPAPTNTEGCWTIYNFRNVL